MNVAHEFHSLNPLMSVNDGEFGQIFTYEMSLHLVSMNVSVY